MNRSVIGPGGEDRDCVSSLFAMRLKCFPLRRMYRPAFINYNPPRSWSKRVFEMTHSAQDRLTAIMHDDDPMIAVIVVPGRNAFSWANKSSH